MDPQVTVALFLIAPFAKRRSARKVWPVSRAVRYPHKWSTSEGDRVEGFSEAEKCAEEAGAEDLEGTPLGEEGRSENPRNRGVTHTRRRGELRFFNEVTQRGLIRTPEEDFAVLGSGFVDGHPVGRCAGVAVDFDVESADPEPLAVRVSIVDVTPGRRARRHSRG